MGQGALAGPGQRRPQKRRTVTGDSQRAGPGCGGVSKKRSEASKRRTFILEQTEPNAFLLPGCRTSLASRSLHSP